jgi:hypothetical protein
MAAESITLNAGSGGSSVATDSVGGLHYQMIKTAAGTDGTAVFGAAPYYYRAAAASNQDSTVVANAASMLYSIACTNTNSSARYLKLYNVNTPTSASTPVQVYALPGSGGIALDFSRGLLFSTALSFRLTTGSADNDANAVAAGEIMVNLGWTA